MDDKPQNVTTGWWSSLQARPRLFYGVILASILSLLYALLQNSYWALGCDNSIYIMSARNILQGRGYVINSTPVTWYPPGWPLAISFLMAISKQFFFLNAVGKILMVAGALFFYVFLSRITSCQKAFIIALLSAVLWRWMRPSYLMSSEALFVPLVGIAFLGAHTASRAEKPPLIWWLILPLLAASLVAIRWAGIVAVIPIAALFARGDLWPRFNRKWMLGTLICTTAASTFCLFYFASPDVYSGPDSSPPPSSTSSKASGNAARATTAHINPSESRPVAEVRGTSPPQLSYASSAASVLNNLSQSGRWITQAVWVPRQLSKTHSWIPPLSNLVGWILIAFILVHGVNQTLQKHWLWVGLAAYCLVLIVRGPPLGRYFVPVMPLLFHGMHCGSATVAGWCARLFSKRWVQRCHNFFVWTSILAIGGFSLTVFVPTVFVQKQQNFYAWYKAGAWGEILSGVRYLRDEGDSDTTVGIIPAAGDSGTPPIEPGIFIWEIAGHKYREIGARYRPRPSHREPPGIYNLDLDYLLVQNPHGARRTWHFQHTWLKGLFAGKDRRAAQPYWRLYRITRDNLQKIPLNNTHQWPTVVPHQNQNATEPE